MSSNNAFGGNLVRVLRFAALVVPVVFSLGFGKTEVPLFLFSGQSNMVGLGTSASSLSGDQKSEVANIKIWVDNESDGSKSKKWLTLGPGFGANSSQFGVELFFGKILADSMPDTKMAFIKFAQSGTWLAKSSEWLPPSSNNGTGGTLYRKMIQSIDAALKKFTDVFDTTQYIPKWAGFIWLQGEFDAMGTAFGNTDPAYANKYEENLTNLIKDIREMAKTEDLPVILPMITTISMWTHAATVRAADIAITTKLANCDTMDTKGYSLAQDNVHYNNASMIKIGTISAQRWLAMKYLEPPVSVINVPARITKLVPLTIRSADYFNVAGRKINARNGNLNGNTPVSSGFLKIIKDESGFHKLINIAP